MSTGLEQVQTLVKEQYAHAVKNSIQLCCTDAYSADEISHVPQAVLDINQGCYSPIQKAQISAGDSVLDLGCGAGLDVFIAAKLVGPKGHVIGVDMSPEMLRVATAHMVEVSEKLGFERPNTEFKEGCIESIPVPDNSQDVVISNCLINLSADKDSVFQEIFRVLKPGGRFVIADVFSQEPVPMYIKYDEELYGTCLGGAMDMRSGLALIRRAGFQGVHLVSTSSYSTIDTTEVQCGTGCC